jgi:predicted O-methyltransferase YrrM
VRFHYDNQLNKIFTEETSPEVTDERLFDWFRGNLRPPFIVQEDLERSQDVRYTQFLLYFLARSAHAKTIVEIGVAEGSTSFPLLKAASETGGIVHSVDPSKNSGPEAVDMVRRNNLNQWWRFHNIESDAFFAEDGKDLIIDFAYIDGDHSYAGIESDTRHVWERLIPGGVIVFHDLGNDDSVYTAKPDNLPQDYLPESCANGTTRVLRKLIPELGMQAVPLSYGAAGLNRFEQWTEGGITIVRKPFLTP